MKSLLLSRKKQFIIYVIACFFPVLNQILTNYGMSLLIGSATEGDINLFWQNILINVGILVTMSIMYFGCRILRIGFIRDIILDVRKLAFEKIQSLSFEGFNKKSKSVYMSHLINDINLFEDNFFVKFINVIFRGGAYVVSLTILAFYDWKFALVIMLLSFIIFGVIRTLEGRTTKMQQTISDSNETMTTDISNTFDGLSLLKLNRVEDAFLSKNLKSIDKLEKKKMHYQVFTESQRNVTRLLSTFIFIGTLLYCLNLTHSGVSMTTITFMIILSNGCIWPLEQIIPFINELKASLSIFEKITSIENNIPNHKDGNQKFAFDKSISVKDVSFSYDDQKIFNNIHLELEKGKKYLLKGASGTGKSTLMKLLSQTYYEYAGYIGYDDINLKDIISEDYNNHVSFIYQDVFLFEDTLLNNITLYRDVDEATLNNAIEKAGLSDFVYNHPDGINRILQENGQDLSGGQRQRISIARAIVKDVDIVFSDEATSSLNPELGAKVEKTLLDLPCTLIAVSHRYYPGVTEDYDAVIEIKNGKVQLYPIDDYFDRKENAS